MPINREMVEKIWFDYTVEYYAAVFFKNGTRNIAFALERFTWGFIEQDVEKNK